MLTIHDESTPIEELEHTAGWLNGRRVTFWSNGRVLPVVAGGDGDDELTDDEAAELEGLSDEDLEALDALTDEQFDALDKLTDEQLDELRGGESEGLDWEAEARKWKRLARKHEQRNKDNRSKKRSGSESGTQRRRSNGDGGDGVDPDALREEGRAAAREENAERVIEVYLDAQVEAGRLTDDQADVLLDSVDARKFIDDDGDVDTAKVKSLIEGIAKPAKGNDSEKKARFPDTGGGRRQGGSRRRGEKATSVAAGRDLYSERRGAKSQKS